MEECNPFKNPDPSERLELDDQEKIELSRDYHEPMRPEVPHFEMHVLIHVAVENQLAENYKEARNALQRLMADGLDRHDAIHAISLMLLEHMNYMVRNRATGKKANKRYDKRLRVLTVDEWLALAE